MILGIFKDAEAVRGGSSKSWSAQCAGKVWDNDRYWHVSSSGSEVYE